MRVRILLYVAFFLGGGTSLVLEVCWFKELSYLLGNSLHAVAGVAAGFMAGLCLGSWLAARLGGRVRNPLRVYAVLQWVIGLCGMCSILVFRSTSPWFEWVYQALSDTPTLFTAVRFGTVLLLMLVPVTLMGMTLPVVVGASARGRLRYDLDAGGLYGINTLGAVAGTLVASFLLIPRLGLLKSTVFIGMLDVAVGLVVFVTALGVRTGEHGDLPQPVRDPSARRPWMIGGVVALAGAAGLALEVAWFRLLALTLAPTVHTFAVMLAVFLAGIGLGSVAEAAVYRRSDRAGRVLLARFAMVAGFLALAGLLYINRLPLWFDALFRYGVDRFGPASVQPVQIVLSAVLILPTALLLGAIFPAAVRAAREAAPDVAPETSVGLLYAANTCGAIVGSVAAGFWALPRVGLRNTIAAAGVALVVGGLALGTGRSTGAVLRKVTVTAVCIILIVAAPAWDAGLFNLGLYQNTYASKPFDLDAVRLHPLVFYEEGINAPVSVYNIAGDGSLRVSGKPDASTAPVDLHTQSLSGHLPMLWAKRREKVAMIGYGSGMTAAAILAHREVRSLIILELEPAVMHASPFFESLHHGALDDPRVTVILEDGRTHMAYGDARYDVITSEPSNPWIAGVANLFSKEFYLLVRQRLTDGGLFAQHLQSYQLSRETYRGVLAAICDVFDHVLLFRTAPDDTILLASDSPIMLPWERFANRFREPGVRRSMLEIDLADPLQVPFFLQVGGTAVRELVRGCTDRNTDDNAWLEYRLPLELFRQWGIGVDPVPAWLAETGSKNRLAGIRSALPGVPQEALVRELLSYPHTREPVDVPGKIRSDPWRRTRVILAQGLVRELQAGGRDDLAGQAEDWELEYDRGRAARIARTARLQAALRSGTLPGRDVLETEWEQDPDHPLAAFLLARVVAGDDPDRARELLKGILARPYGPMAYDAMLLLGRLEEQDTRFREAAAWYRQAAARNPFRSAAFVALRDVELRNGNTQTAAKAVSEGLRFNPTSPDLR